MNPIEQVRKMCMNVVQKHVNAGVMRSVEATTRADTAKLIAAEIAALELPTAPYMQCGYAVLLRSQIDEPLPIFNSIWAEHTVAQDYIKAAQILIDQDSNSKECDLVAVPVFFESKKPEKNLEYKNLHEICRIENEEIKKSFERTHCTLNLERRRDGTYARDKTAEIFNTYRSGFYEAKNIKPHVDIETELDMINDQVTVAKCNNEKLISMLENLIKKLRSASQPSTQPPNNSSSLPQTIFTTDVIETNRTHGAISKGDE